MKHINDYKKVKNYFVSIAQPWIHKKNDLTPMLVSDSISNFIAKLLIKAKGGPSRVTHKILVLHSLGWLQYDPAQHKVDQEFFFPLQWDPTWKNPSEDDHTPLPSDSVVVKPWEQDSTMGITNAIFFSMHHWITQRIINKNEILELTVLLGDVSNIITVTDLNQDGKEGITKRAKWIEQNFGQPLMISGRLAPSLPQIFCFYSQAINRKLNKNYSYLSEHTKFLYSLETLYLEHLPHDQSCIFVHMEGHRTRIIVVRIEKKRILAHEIDHGISNLLSLISNEGPVSDHSRKEVWEDLTKRLSSLLPLDACELGNIQTSFHIDEVLQVFFSKTIGEIRQAALEFGLNGDGYIPEKLYFVCNGAFSKMNGSPWVDAMAPMKKFFRCFGKRVAATLGYAKRDYIYIDAILNSTEQNKKFIKSIDSLVKAKRPIDSLYHKDPAHVEPGPDAPPPSEAGRDYNWSDFTVNGELTPPPRQSSTTEPQTEESHTSSSPSDSNKKDKHMPPSGKGSSLKGNKFWIIIGLIVYAFILLHFGSVLSRWHNQIVTKQNAASQSETTSKADFVTYTNEYKTSWTDRLLLIGQEMDSRIRLKNIQIKYKNKNNGSIELQLVGDFYANNKTDEVSKKELTSYMEQFISNKSTLVKYDIQDIQIGNTDKSNTSSINFKIKLIETKIGNAINLQ